MLSVRDLHFMLRSLDLNGLHVQKIIGFFLNLNYPQINKINKIRSHGNSESLWYLVNECVCLHREFVNMDHVCIYWYSLHLFKQAVCTKWAILENLEEVLCVCACMCMVCAHGHTCVCMEGGRELEGEVQWPKWCDLIFAVAHCKTFQYHN